MASINAASNELRRAQLVWFLTKQPNREIFDKKGRAAVRLTEKGGPFYGIQDKAVSLILKNAMAAGTGKGIVRIVNGKRTLSVALLGSYTPSDYEIRFGKLAESLPGWLHMPTLSELDLRIVEFLRTQHNFEFGVDKGTVPKALHEMEEFGGGYMHKINAHLKYLAERGVIKLLPPGKGKHHFVKLIRLTESFVLGDEPETKALEETPLTVGPVEVGTTQPLPDVTPASADAGDLDYDKLAKSLLLEALNVIGTGGDRREVDELRAQVAQLQNEGRTANEVIKDLGLTLHEEEKEIVTLQQLVTNLRAEITAMERKGYRIKDLVSDPEREALDRLIKERPRVAV